MAIRKVSDLEKLEVLEVYDSVLSANLDDMLLEVSYPMDLGGKTYRSMKTLFGDLADIANAEILCSQTIVDFYSPITFHNNVSALCGFWISGDFYVNKDCPDTIFQNYETILKSGNTTIYSVLTNILSSPETNLIASPTNIICSNTQLLAKFTDLETILTSSSGQLRVGYPTIQIGYNGDTPSNTIIDGNLSVTNVINGCSLCAKWADLAEIYAADDDYEPGTLVKFGGVEEITVADTQANAVVTTNPGLVLGGCLSSETKFYKGIALVGRVPVKCIGQVKKFDKVSVSKTPGFAEVAAPGNQQVVGIALEDGKSDLSSLVECVVKLAF